MCCVCREARQGGRLEDVAARLAEQLDRLLGMLARPGDQLAASRQHLLSLCHRLGGGIHQREKLNDGQQQCHLQQLEAGQQLEQLRQLGAGISRAVRLALGSQVTRLVEIMESRPGQQRQQTRPASLTSFRAAVNTVQQTDI